MQGNPRIINNSAARWVIYALLAVATWPVVQGQVQARDAHNGFDLSNSVLAAGAIQHGGPPRDGIPALMNPDFIPASQASYLADGDRVLGVVSNGQASAYPLRILAYHEIVNLHSGGESLLVTYCPLCGTGIAFSALVDGKQLEFGVSGLLYNNDLLLYDRKTESLWSQITGTAVTGSMVGQKLKRLTLTQTSWADWRQRHPDTQVLDINTGFARDYGSGPYAGYGQSEQVYFPLTHTDKRYHPKEQVIGLELNGQFRAYPFVELSRLGTNQKIAEEFAGEQLQITFNEAARTGQVIVNGNLVPTITGYWFAWIAFHPQTSVWASASPN